MGWLEDLFMSGGAPIGARYVTLAVDDDLTQERVLAAGEGVTLADGGAGASVTVALDDSGVDAGTYDRVTVDAKGRVTAGVSQGETGGWTELEAGVDFATTAADKLVIELNVDWTNTIRPGMPIRVLDQAGHLFNNDYVA